MGAIFPRLCKRCRGARFWRRLGVAAGVAVDRAEFVSGGAVLFLLGDGGEVGEVVVGGHRDVAMPEAGEGRVVIEERIMLRIDVYEIEGAGVPCEGVFDVAEEAAEDGKLEGVEEEGESRFGGEWVGGGVGMVKGEGGEGFGEGVAVPEVDVGLGDGGEVGVELDAFDAEEGIAGGNEKGAAFTGADVEEDGFFDGRGEGEALEPEVEEGLEDGGCDAVVGGELGDFGGGALRDDFAGDEAGGVGAVELIEGVDDGLGFAGRH